MHFDIGSSIVHHIYYYPYYVTTQVLESEFNQYIHLCHRLILIPTILPLLLFPQGYRVRLLSLDLKCS